MVSDLEALKEQYQLKFSIKDTLDSKSNNITIISGVVATLLFGFGQLFGSKLAVIQYIWLSEITFILPLGCLASLAAILFSVLGFRITNYSYVIGFVLWQRVVLSQITYTYVLHPTEPEFHTGSYISSGITVANTYSPLIDNLINKYKDK